MNLLRTVLCAAAVGAGATLAFGAATSMTAQDFATAAGSSDMFEIELSKMALTKAQSAEVKQFAQMMITDHTAASAALKTAAAADGVAVPAQMVKKDVSGIDALEGASGAVFDANYIDAQVNAHQQAVALLSSYAQNGQAAALKAHAQKTLPTVQMHLQHIEQLDSRM